MWLICSPSLACREDHEEEDDQHKLKEEQTTPDSSKQSPGKNQGHFSALLITLESLKAFLIEMSLSGKLH